MHSELSAINVQERQRILRQFLYQTISESVLKTKITFNILKMSFSNAANYADEKTKSQ